MCSIILALGSFCCSFVVVVFVLQAAYAAQAIGFMTKRFVESRLFFFSLI